MGSLGSHPRQSCPAREPSTSAPENRPHQLPFPKALRATCPLPRHPGHALRKAAGGGSGRKRRAAPTEAAAPGSERGGTCPQRQAMVMPGDLGPAQRETTPSRVTDTDPELSGNVHCVRHRLGSQAAGGDTTWATIGPSQVLSHRENLAPVLAAMRGARLSAGEGPANTKTRG